jgi:parvulin-like peptidyl-prolyl isomerase
MTFLPSRRASAAPGVLIAVPAYGRPSNASTGLSARLEAYGYAAAPVNRGFLSKRNLAILFGATLVLTVAIVAAAVGLGHPSVPSDAVAVVDDDSINVPGLVQDGTISKTNFNRFLVQTAKQNGVQTVPPPSSPQYKQLKDQTMQSALQIAWVVGEANKRGLTFTNTQINQSLQQIKSQFKTPQEYVKARDQAGLTEADVVVRAKLQLIQSKIQNDISSSVGTVSTSDARKYYDANQQQFSQPAKRTIRIIQNNDAHQINLAYQALRTDASPANWKKVAAQYSTDTTSKDKGGLRTDVVPGSFQQPLDDDIFSAPTGQIQGPVHTPTANYVFEVISATPKTVQAFDDTTSSAAGGPPAKISDLIKQQIKSQQQQQALSSFGEHFRAYWTNLTQCGSDYLVQGCDNFNGGGPTCDPSKLGPSQTGQPSQGCPAPVFASCQEGSATTGGQSGQLQCTGSGPTPGAPGSFKPFVVPTGSAPQGPHPAGEGTAPAGGVSIPGLTGG